MTRSLATLPALLLLAAAARAADTSVLVSGAPLSWGPGYRVTARLTFDRRKAASGGFVFATPRVTAADEQPIRLSQAVLTGRGGVLGAAGLLSRRHRVPALSLPQARWESGALVVSLPVFGAPVSEGGAAVRPLARMEARRLLEDEVVSVDAADGLLILHDPAEQAFELDLAQALRAFDGLKDLQALLQWYDGKTEGAASPALAARLVEEVASRLAAGTATEAELSRARRAVDSGLDGEGRRATAAAAARAAARQIQSLSDTLEELATDAAEAGSAAAAQRAAAEGRRALAAARALGAGVGKPALARPVEQAERTLAAAARRRAAELARRPAGTAAALASAGLILPERVEIPGALYERFLSESGLAATLSDIADDASLDLRRKGERLAAVFAGARISPSSAVGKELLALLPKAALFVVCGPEGCRPRAAPAAALDEVRAAWAMSWSPDALGRRKRQGRALAPPVLTVEALEPAEVSGRAFSRDPVSGSPRRLAIEAVFGEPDALISGQVSADEYALERRTLADALPPLIADPRGRCLSPELTAWVARAARSLDDELGQAVELTFAVSGGKVIARSWRALPSR